MDELQKAHLNSKNSQKTLAYNELKKKLALQSKKYLATRFHITTLKLSKWQVRRTSWSCFVKGFVKNLVKTYSVTGIDVISKLDLVYKQKELEHFESYCK